MSTPLIELKNIFRTFGSGENETTVLNGVNLTIKQGEFIAIVGASGSGKTTLMNIIGCLDKPSLGEYRFNSKNISDFDKDELAKLRRESFGFIFQSYHLIHSLSASENVEIPAVYAGIPKQTRQKRAYELLASLGLEHRVDYLPSKLSGGQQQRVSISRALMNGGQIILADEPTGALDSKSGAEVMRLLQELSESGHTIILITHDMKIAQNAHRIVEIKDGEILNDSKKDGVTENKNFYFKAKDEPSFIYEVSEAIKMAIKSLKTNIFRTILTLLGIVIGVASVITMLAIGDGAKKDVVDKISSMGTNILMIFPGMPNTRGRGGVNTLVLEDAHAINELDNIIAAMPEARKGVTVRYGNNDKTTNLNANSWAYGIVRDWSVEKGVFFSKEDEDDMERVAVLGSAVEQAIFPNDDPIGKFVVIDNIMFQVIGVMSSKGASAMGDDEDDVVFVPYTTGNLHIIGQTSLRNIRVGITDISKSLQTEEAIRSLLIQRHGVEDFRVTNMSSLIQSMEETQNTLTILLGSIAAISLLVGGIGVMNIMLVSVTERTKEIGIRVATGARRRNIVQQFLIEALIVSALGGIIGIICGIGATFIVSKFGTTVVYSMLPVVLAFSCAFLTGLIFGYLPAKKAAKLDPVIALSGE
ncbi:MAG: MacB family efflux pump subunit [Campylobacteraceae bacterium]|nr:MacB family efflux pump subunit [Campylobacteraceae bacterium]